MPIIRSYWAYRTATSTSASPMSLGGAVPGLVRLGPALDGHIHGGLLGELVTNNEGNSPLALVFLVC
jgi:hypothetical protein